MNFLGAVVALGALILVGAFLTLRRRSRDRYGGEPAAVASYVRVMAIVDAPTRNLAATLPRRSQADADADRYFGYERIREPRYRPDLDPARAELLRPLQVVRFGSESERKALELSVPPHMNAVFVAADSSLATAAPRDDRGE